MNRLLACERTDRFGQRLLWRHRGAFDENRDDTDFAAREGVDDLQPDVIVRLIEPPAAFRVAGVEPLASDHREKHAALGQA